MNFKSKWQLILGSCFVVCALLAQSAFAADKTVALNRAYFHQQSGQAVTITLLFSDVVPKGVHSFVTKSPSQRLVLDLPHVRNNLGNKAKDFRSDIARRLVATQAKDKTRIVIDLKKKSSYKIATRGKRLTITLGPQLHKRKLPVKSVLHKPAHSENWIKHVDFKRTEQGGSRLVVSLGNERSEIDMQQHGTDLVLKFISTHLPSKLRHDMDVTDFATPVDKILLKQEGNNVVMRVKAHGDHNPIAYQKGKIFIVDIEPMKVKKDRSGTILRTDYNGDKVSLNFQNIEVRAVLQLLAEFTGLNIVTDDSVTGTITLHLQNVPWDQALAIILKTRGLAERQIGNVILVAPAGEIAKREQEELQSQNKIEDISQLHSQLLQINYARAADIAGLIKSQKSTLLSQRGRISSDARTNTIWVRDTGAKLNDIRSLVEKLDVPVRQVAIEARIVDITKNYEYEFGLGFGVSKKNTGLSGTATAAEKMKEDGGVGEATLANRYNVLFPLEKSFSKGQHGTIGLALAKLGHGFLLDLELQAAEADNKVNVLSTPHVITANQHTAKIEKGVEIPFQQATSSGATAVSFKKAVLSLEVTPQITPNNQISLDLKVHEDSKGEVESGVPGINTKNIETQVLVDNGGTVVLGGIYTQDKQNEVKRVPFFGDIPVIGNLFKKTYKLNKRTELLIFITPKIIDEVATG